MPGAPCLGRAKRAKGTEPIPEPWPDRPSDVQRRHRGAAGCLVGSDLPGRTGASHPRRPWDDLHDDLGVEWLRFERLRRLRTPVGRRRPHTEKLDRCFRGVRPDSFLEGTDFSRGSRGVQVALLAHRKGTPRPGPLRDSSAATTDPTSWTPPIHAPDLPPEQTGGCVGFGRRLREVEPGVWCARVGVGVAAGLGRGGPAGVRGFWAGGWAAWGACVWVLGAGGGGWGAGWDVCVRAGLAGWGWAGWAGRCARVAGWCARAWCAWQGRAGGVCGCARVRADPRGRVPCGWRRWGGGEHRVSRVTGAARLRAGAWREGAGRGHGRRGRSARQAGHPTPERTPDSRNTFADTPRTRVRESDP